MLEAAVAAAGRYGLGSEHELERWRWARDHFVFAFSTGKPTSLLPSEGSPCNGPGSPIHLQCNRSNYQVGMVAYLWNHGIPHAINASVLQATWALEERLRNIEQTCPPNPKGTTPLPGPWCYSNVPTTELTPGFTVPPFYAMAAHFGNRSTALELWRRMPTHFMRGPWALFCEYDCRWAGSIYLTTAASVLQSTMFGVVGLRPWSLATNLSDASPDSFVHFEARLPEGWDAVEIGRVFLSGRPYSVRAEHGKRPALTLLDGSYRSKSDDEHHERGDPGSQQLQTALNATIVRTDEGLGRRTRALSSTGSSTVWTQRLATEAGAMLVIHLAVHISSAGYSLAVKHDDIGTCNFSYAPQHSYSTLDLSYQNIDTHGIWYVDGDVMFSGSTIAEFTSQTSQTLGSRLRTYFTGGGKWQRNISGGLQTTNAVVFDIETPVNLKLLGTFLAAERANGSQIFQQTVDAYKLRAQVARTLLPHAKLSFYGSPNGPASFTGENFSLSTEGYLEAAKRGIFDQVDSLIPVLYFGNNISSPDHGRVFGFNNATMDLASRIPRSDGSTIPIWVNTKPTYRFGPHLPPFSGWLEKSTMDALVSSWRATANVERIIWWFYPDFECCRGSAHCSTHYEGNPSLAEVADWFRTRQPVPQECLGQHSRVPRALKFDDGGASVSSTAIECTWTNNTDYWGNIDDRHIALRANVTRQQCCSLCKRHPNCSFAVFGVPSEHPPSACWLKHGMPSRLKHVYTRGATVCCPMGMLCPAAKPPLG
eukprot:COSAG04_NODE_627_length_11777_cov_62.455557_2_plen_763_part_00